MPELPAAASALVAPVVDGPRRCGVVVASFPTSLYAVLDDPDLPPSERLVALLGPGALRLPMGMRLATGRSVGGWASGSVGDPVVVGSGWVELPQWSARVVRVWQPTRVRCRASATSGPSAASGHRAARPGGSLGCVPEPLAQADVAPHLVSRAAAFTAAALGGGSVAEALRPLVGAGPGLTPSGDDAVCGALLVLHGLGRCVPSALDSAAVRTTSLSAALLSAARQGYAVPEVVRLVDAVLDEVVDARVGGAALRAALPDVLAIGHSSGRDLVAGVVGALRAWTAAGPVAPPASDCRTVIRLGRQPAHRFTEGCGP
jgi:hypothetical protein